MIIDELLVVDMVFFYIMRIVDIEVKATVRSVGLLGDRQWGMNFQDQIRLIGEFNKLGRYT